uniref:Uncharacterized protein n=1 Tax=Lactuca sativa TaxID=4236 RepID=A0A9R1WLB7_LACSA|nr:hypothetical protein LSAT_V11C100022060 [Lactuca sativa]
MYHSLRGWAVECTFKGALGTVLKKYITKLNSRRVELFRETTYVIFIGMPTPNGDLMLCYLMMLHEVRDVEVARVGKFGSSYKAYGETEFCLISGLRFGPYVDITNTKVSISSTLRNQLFPNVRDEDLRLKDLEDYINGPSFSTCSDEDAYDMFAWGTYLWRYSETQLRLWFGKINRYLRDNESVGYTKMIKYTVTGFQLPFKTFPEALRFAHHTENEIPRMRAWRIKTQLSLEQCLRILDVSMENKIPRIFEPTPVEIHLSFFVRYINWTLDKVQSPPQQQSPPKERSPSPQQQSSLKQQSPSPQQQSPPKQRSASPHPSQFQEANYTSGSHFRGADYTLASHFQETYHKPTEDSKIDMLFGDVTQLKTTIEHFGKRMDKWEKINNLIPSIEALKNRKVKKS